MTCMAASMHTISSRARCNRLTSATGAFSHETMGGVGQICHGYPLTFRPAHSHIHDDATWDAPEQSGRRDRIESVRGGWLMARRWRRLLRRGRMRLGRWSRRIPWSAGRPLYGAAFTLLLLTGVAAIALSLIDAPWTRALEMIDAGV